MILYCMIMAVTNTMAHLKKRYSGTCVLWTPWDQPKASGLSRCPDFPDQFI